MATAHKVGGEIDAFCNKDKMQLAHTILAMVGEKVARVQCNTCKSEHAYRGKAPVARKPRSTPESKAAAAAAKITVTFDQLMSAKDMGQAKKYSARETFSKDDLIDHPTFGFGIVQEARTDKVTVLFKMEEKTLVHARGGAPVEKPVFKPSRGATRGPADKPQPEGIAPDANETALLDETPGGDDGQPQNEPA